MIDFLNRYSAPIPDDGGESKDSSVFEERKAKNIQPKATCTRKDETTSENRSGVCFFMHSSTVSEEKPSMIQERTVSSEIWNGYVIGVNEECAYLEVRSTKNPLKRLRLKVQKQIVVGNVANIQLGMSVSVSYQRIVNYQGRIKKEAIVRLREPALLPEAVLESEHQEKLKRFSYMFDE